MAKPFPVATCLEKKKKGFNWEVLVVVLNSIKEWMVLVGVLKPIRKGVEA